MNVTSSKTQGGIVIIATALTILFFYTAISKLLDMDEFHRQLANQTLPDWSVAPLLWTIPLSELLTSGLLLFGFTRRTGLYCSAALMLLFTGYMSLVLMNVFERVPCSCGGVIRHMGFTGHFLFNLFFLTLSGVGIYLLNHQKKGGHVATSDHGQQSRE